MQECTNALIKERNISKLTNFHSSILFARQIFIARTDFLHIYSLMILRSFDKWTYTPNIQWTRYSHRGIFNHQANGIFPIIKAFLWVKSKVSSRSTDILVAILTCWAFWGRKTDMNGITRSVQSITGELTKRLKREGISGSNKCFARYRKAYIGTQCYIEMSQVHRLLEKSDHTNDSIAQRDCEIDQICFIPQSSIRFCNFRNI
jgi:hypothetical protein